MTASKSLPARPSLESLRKQAKRLARDIAAGDAAAIARARRQLPDVDLPLTQRNAQLVIAREYGYAGWQDLTAEVRKRLGHGLKWAAAQARRVIHDNDVERQESLPQQSLHAEASSRGICRPVGRAKRAACSRHRARFSVINRHFDVADFLLEHGANINTDWNSHEPASILHHLVMLPNPYESMRFLIDRGIDMTIKDYRWGSNAASWARAGYNNEKMAQWLEDAERQQKRRLP